MGDGEKLLTYLNSALKALLGFDIFPRVPKKKSEILLPSVIAARNFANALKIHYVPKFLGLRKGHFRGERVSEVALTHSKSRYLSEIWQYLEVSSFQHITSN